MPLKEDFTRATQDVQKLSKRPDNDTLLELYALFKQATDGDISGTRPGLLDLKGRKKYDAWNSKKGTSADKAMNAYVTLVQKISSN